MMDKKVLRDTFFSEIVKMLSSVYKSIFMINLTTDSFLQLPLREGLKPAFVGGTAQMSAIFRTFAEAGNIYEGDLKKYFAFIERENLRKHFRESRESLRLRYRQKVSGVLRWFSFEIFRGLEYAEGNEVVMLYVKDIHDEYMAEINHRKEIDCYCNFDISTGIWNRHYLGMRDKEYCKGAERYPIAAVFVSVGIALGNDRRLDRENDIDAFVGLLSVEFGKGACYRFGSDEFVVLLEHEEEEDAMAEIEAFYKSLERQTKLAVSIGYAWRKAPETIADLVCLAQKQIYQAGI